MSSELTVYSGDLERILDLIRGSRHPLAEERQRLVAMYADEFDYKSLIYASFAADYHRGSNPFRLEDTAMAGGTGLVLDFSSWESFDSLFGWIIAETVRFHVDNETRRGMGVLLSNSRHAELIMGNLGIEEYAVILGQGDAPKDSGKVIIKPYYPGQVDS